MSLSPGTMLGSYSVTAKIGEGGMGEVWQARDTKLDRDVALKVLPEAFTSDPDRLARFEREAKILASLNHPNIAAIHGLEESDGIRALVLELVEGPTLAERIAQGPIPLDEASPIARQIAEALEAAHERGVIHRDLKPANVKVKADGMVKVLDFGLAKAFQPDASDPNLSASPTISLTAAATPIPGTESGQLPFFSPDGLWVGFFASGTLKKVSLDGRPPVTLCVVPGVRRGASWASDDTILFNFSGSNGMWRVAAAGGEAEPLAATTGPDPGVDLRWPDMLPDGSAALITVWASGLNDAQVGVVSLATGELTPLVAGSSPRYSPTGHIVYWREDSLWAVPFDAQQRELTGRCCRTGRRRCQGQPRRPGPLCAWRQWLGRVRARRRGGPAHARVGGP